MSCEIVVREARPSDAAARDQLVRQGFSSHTKDAFLLFFFQELTLQLVVLGGAVLFIFCGASVRACAALLPLAAAAAALAVHLAHTVLADKHVQNMRRELVGFVAELRGPLLLDPASAAPRVRLETELQNEFTKPYSTKVVGTVSVSEFWGPQDSGWMHALAVHAEWEVRTWYHRRLAGAALTLLVAHLGLDLPHA